MCPLCWGNLSGTQIAFLVFLFSVSLVIKGLLVNICVKVVQAYHLSSTCGPVLSTRIHSGKYKHWILTLLRAHSQERADCYFSVVKKQHSMALAIFSDCRDLPRLSGLSEYSSKRSFSSKCKGKELTIFIAYLIYLYISMSVVGTLHMPPTFLIPSPFTIALVQPHPHG